VLPTLGSRDLWAFDEVRHASALRHLLEDGRWLVLYMNGEPYGDKPPVYFWLVAAAARLLGRDGLDAFVLVSGLGGFLLAAVTWLFARRYVAVRAPPSEPGAGERLAWIAALGLMATPLFQLLLRTTRMDHVFAALLLGSTLLLWRGLSAERPSGSVVAAGALAGLAALVKGPLGLLLPYVGTVAWLLWEGRGARLLCRDVSGGLLVALALVEAWGAAIVLVEGRPFLERLVTEQLVGRAVDARQQPQPFWFYLPVLPLSLLPFSLLLVGVPWRRALAPRAWRALWAARRERRSPRAFLVLWPLGNLVLLSVFSSKLFIYVLPLLPPLLVLCAEQLLEGDERRRRGFFRAAGVSAFLVAAGAVGAIAWDAPVDLPRGALASTALLAAALGVLCLRFAPSRSPRGGAEVVAIGGQALFLVLALFVAPALDAIMSPRRQAERMRELADQGYAPLVFAVYPGTYSWHGGRTWPETRDPEVLRAHLASPKAFVATTRRHYERHRAWFDGYEVVQEQRIEAKPFVLLARPAPTSRGPR
jgi:4-amino-4-deoxy-L-arabinose transferase-like glycosyltransferase